MLDPSGAAQGPPPAPTATPPSAGIAMSSLFGHALAGLAISAACTRSRPPRRVWAFAVACAVAPDLDWFMEFFQLSQRASLAHRGISHSLLAALLIAVAAMLIGFRPQLRSARLWTCMLAASFSHGLLDACTFGGTGVAFLLPFSNARFVGAWQPIFVSPIPLSGKLLDWLLFSLGTEIVWIGLPAAVVFFAPQTMQRLRLSMQRLRLRWKQSEESS
ncbi:metal-dependent hydrolase [Geothrix sp. PMB-07]|uniref:metal-dependent hydrolase n=1 Tax=Geothrix sp. PMB-07 TaxID=3068640 RepID=UPI0027420832|nr:metal-dependent hydrolase [Geothrix sp. PMB-07]WLT31049.1 metal-dependent hydrolase [Geothrix sp. PMB-07]